MMIYFKGVLSSLYHGGPNDVPNRTEGRDANNQHNRIDIEEAVYSDSEKYLFTNHLFTIVNLWIENSNVQRYGEFKNVFIAI